MTTKREALVAYRAAVLDAGAIDVRIKLTLASAVHLATEVQDSELRFPDEVRAACAMHEAYAKQPEPEGFDAKLKWMQDRKIIVDAFWSAFAGEVVDGVEIVRGES